jgi:hypothetical protein
MKKTKRYEGGGEVEESSAKQRGLDISNKEAPVGFFERLRAGNIDDPSSEAYKRFGAGRGRAAAPDAPAASAPTRTMAAAASSPDLSDDMYSDFGPSAGRSSGETVMPTRATATKPAAPVKSAKVTKEELEKSGLSLRDYLNKQQGLTRKESAKESVKESAKPAMSDAEAMAKKMGPRFNPAGAAPKQTMGRQRQPFMPGDVDNSFPGAKFKGGGKVRSASARADGIAIRGKTRA